MIKKLVISIILSLSLFIPYKAFALDHSPQGELRSKDGLSMDDINRFTTYYYLNPQPDQLIKVLKFFLNQEQLLTDTVHFGPMEHFFATAAHEDKSILSSLKSLKKQYLEIQGESISRIVYQAENFVSPNPNAAKDLDYLWSEFFATGRDEPVKKIISALSYSTKDLETRIVAGAAEWSLAANARQHKKVYEIIQMEYVISKDKKIRDKLGDILQKLSGR